MKRRNFLSHLSTSAAGITLLPLLPLSEVKANTFVSEKQAIRKKVLKVGICSDVHQDLMHDGEKRLQTFINEMNKLNDVDFIIQLGDFCRPYDYNQPFMDIWNQFKGPSYHVLGNHDTDGGFTQDQVVSFFKAKGKYYSFDMNGYHFVALNGNEKNPNTTSKGYSRFISEEQRNWLAKDLDNTTFPVIIFCHQSFDIDILGSIEQATFTRLIFEEANMKAGFQKIKAIFSGHHHTDFHNVINGINYVQINSMSNYWAGENYAQIRYDEKIDEKYPYIKYTIPYKEPLWAVMTIYSDGEINIKGRQTSFVGSDPKEMGIGLNESGYSVVSYISDRILK